MIARRKDAKSPRKSKKRVAEEATEGNRLDDLSSGPSDEPDSEDGGTEAPAPDAAIDSDPSEETGTETRAKGGKGRGKGARRKKPRRGSARGGDRSGEDDSGDEVSGGDVSGGDASSEPTSTAATASAEAENSDQDQAEPRAKSGNDDAPTDEKPDDAAAAPAPDGLDDEGEVRLEGLRLRQVLESILFAAGEPISAVRLRRLLPEAKPAAIREELLALQGDLASQARGFTLVEENGGYRLLTRMEFAPYVSRLRGNKRRIRLSKAAFETLAVIAYRQPVRRADLDAIRGVQSSAIVKNLLEWNLVKVVGQDEGIGKALLFGTTVEFLDQFGLASLSDLPHPSEFSDFRSEAPSEIEVDDEEPSGGAPEGDVDAGSVHESETDDTETDDTEEAIAATDDEAARDPVADESPDSDAAAEEREPVSDPSPTAESDSTESDAESSEPVEVSLAKGETGDERP